MVRLILVGFGYVGLSLEKSNWDLKSEASEDLINAHALLVVRATRTLINGNDGFEWEGAVNEMMMFDDESDVTQWRLLYYHYLIRLG